MKSRTYKVLGVVLVLLWLVLMGHLLGGADQAILHGPRFQFGF